MMEPRKNINLLAPGVDEEEMAKKADLIDGKVPASQLPSYVDDVVEYASTAEFPNPGEQGKIYVAIDSGFTYRWSGSEYIQIGGQDLSDYYTKSEADQLLETKQPVGDYATNTALEEGLAGKQDVGDYATNSALESGLATKQPVGDYATNTALTEGLATKQPVGDYATNNALETGLATKQDNISDLDTIRAGAAAGATAVQPTDISTISELDIRRLFRTEYAISTTVLNGVYSGDDSIWTEETATVTIEANSGYSLPETIVVSGATYTYDDTTGAIALSAATGNVSINAECPLPKLITPVISIDSDTLSVSTIQGADQLQVYDGDTLVGSLTPPPSKGDIIKFDAMGDGNLKRFRVFSVDGNIAYLLSMTDRLNETYFAEASGTYYYANSLVDKYCNETYFNQLSVDVQNAIVDTEIQQDGWYRRVYDDELKNPSQYITTIRVEDGKIEGRNWRENIQNIGLRHCFALSIQDLCDYVGAVNGDTVNMPDFVNMLPDGYDHKMWLRSALRYRYDSSWKLSVGVVARHYVSDHVGVWSESASHTAYSESSVYPAFRIDLTKIVWQKEVA